jgi:hypothetical protein
MRSPNRSNFDVTFFKNFDFTETKKLQFRVGLFNAFNQAYANPDLGDINLTLETQNAINPATGTCFLVNNVPNGVGTTNNVCDPTKGYTFTQNTLTNFGNIVKKHGHRRIELALKFYF